MHIDASFSQQNKVGVGICLRDELGSFMCAKMHWFQPIVNPKMGKIYGLLEAIEWVHELGFKDVIFGMDSKIIVDGMQGPINITEFGDTIQYCKSTLASFCKNSHSLGERLNWLLTT